MEYPFKDLLPLDEVLEREGYYKDWTHLDPKVFYSLTQISEYIKTKGFGVDVRLLIAQLAEHFSLKTTQINETERFFKDIMLELGKDKEFHSLPEIAGARRGYDTLAESLGNLSVNMINKNLGKLDQTYMSDELLQQMAGNTPVNAVPADGSLTTQKYADESVTAEKTDFIKNPTNIFDPSSLVSSYIISDNGGLQPNASYNATLDFIPILGGEEYRVHTGSSAKLYFYDVNKEPITFIAIASSSGGNWSGETPDNAYFYRIHLLKGNEGITQINKGTELLPYTPYFSPRIDLPKDLHDITLNYGENGDLINVKNAEGTVELLRDNVGSITGVKEQTEKETIIRNLITDETGKVIKIESEKETVI